MHHKHKRKGFPIIAYGVKQILTTAAVESMETDNENFYFQAKPFARSLVSSCLPQCKTWEK